MAKPKTAAPAQKRKMGPKPKAPGGLTVQLVTRVDEATRDAVEAAAEAMAAASPPGVRVSIADATRALLLEALAHRKVQASKG